MKLGILNAAVLTADGDYTIRTITPKQARDLAQAAEAEIDSAVGHESTSAILTELLGVDVPVHRQLFAQQAGQKALVFKLNGRPPEGRILSREDLEQIGYSFKLLTRLS